jgi:hypothetical protein
MMVPNSSIEQQWEIMANPGNADYSREDFPFLVVCTVAGKHMGFPCRTVDEAHGKLNAVAEVLFGSQPLAVA